MSQFAFSLGGEYSFTSTIQSGVERTKKSSDVKREGLWRKAGAKGFGGYYRKKKSLKPLVQCLAIVRKANRIMDCINRGANPNQKACSCYCTA